MEVTFNRRYLFIKGLKDETVNVDMYDLLTRDNIEFRLGVLLNALPEEIDTELLQGYFFSAAKYYELEPEDSISKSYDLRANRRLFEVKYVMQSVLKRGRRLDGKDIEKLMKNGYFFIAATTAAKGIPEPVQRARFRKLTSSLEENVAMLPEIHYGTLFNEEMHNDTVIAWTDENLKKYLERTFIEDAADARIEKTISFEDGKTFSNTWLGPEYSREENGKYKASVFDDYRYSLSGTHLENSKDVAINERYTENMDEDYRNDKLQIEAMTEILRHYDLDKKMDPRSVETIRWDLLLPMAIQEDKII